MTTLDRPYLESYEGQGTIPAVGDAVVVRNRYISSVPVTVTVAQVTAPEPNCQGSIRDTDGNHYPLSVLYAE